MSLIRSAPFLGVSLIVIVDLVADFVFKRLWINVSVFWKKFFIFLWKKNVNFKMKHYMETPSHPKAYNQSCNDYRWLRMTCFIYIKQCGEVQRKILSKEKAVYKSISWLIGTSQTTALLSNKISDNSFTLKQDFKQRCLFKQNY